jgi:hypothetical protein
MLDLLCSEQKASLLELLERGAARFSSTTQGSQRIVMAVQDKRVF